MTNVYLVIGKYDVMDSVDAPRSSMSVLGSQYTVDFFILVFRKICNVIFFTLNNF